MSLGPGEPPAGPWRSRPIAAFAAEVCDAAGRPSGRPRIIAVDGRGGSGKTTLAARLATALPDAALVHSDDVAWQHSRFGWDELMLTGVLGPLHMGSGVRFRPPAWAPLGRSGTIDVPASATTVLIEGVGVSRRSLTPLLDTAIWVQSDFAEARKRGVDRDMHVFGCERATVEREWSDWEAEEIPFLLADEPWLRARFTVGTASSLRHDPEQEVMVAA